MMHRNKNKQNNRQS